MSVRTRFLHAFVGVLVVGPLVITACGGSDGTNTGGEPGEDGGSDTRTDALQTMNGETDADALDALDATSEPPIDAGSDAGNDATTDATLDAPVDTGVDGAVDAGHDAALDAPVDAYVPPPVGTQLETGNDLSVRGVTSDGYVIYSDDAALTLHAVPLAGGATQDLGPLGGKFWVTLVGKTVFSWSNVTDPNVGVLRTWSSSSGLHVVSSASFGILATSSPAGDRILYLDNVDAPGETGDITLAATDGTGAKKLVTGAKLSGCFPQLGFVGSYVLTSYCPVPRNDGPSSTISSFASPSWTKVDLAAPAANYWSTDAAGTKVLVSTPAGVQVAPIGGGALTTIDATGFFGTLLQNGQTAIYSTVTGGFRRSPVAAPSPMTLVSSGFGGAYAMSADEQWVLGAKDGGDLYLLSTTVPGTPTTLSAAQTAGIRGDAFTTDSSHALYVLDSDPSTGAGAFRACPVGGGAPAALGQNVWGDWAATAAKVVFAANFESTGGLRFGRADIEVVDTAQSAAPTRMVTRADAVIGVSPSKDRIVYAWSAQAGPLAGLYVTPIP